MSSGRHAADEAKDSVKHLFSGFESARENINSFADELLSSRHHNHTVDNTADMHSREGTRPFGGSHDVHPASGPGSHFHSTTSSNPPHSGSHVNPQSGTSADAQKTGLGGAVEKAGAKLDESMHHTEKSGGSA